MDLEETKFDAKVKANLLVEKKHGIIFFWIFSYPPI